MAGHTRREKKKEKKEKEFVVERKIIKESDFLLFSGTQI